MMKRFSVLLFCCLLATWSCKMESTFYMENVDALVTVVSGQLVSDEGVTFNVVENKSGRQDFLVPDARYYMNYDILNSHLDIRIRQLLDVFISPASPVTEEKPGHDPVVLLQGGVSGGYLNLALGVYKAKGSNHAHPIVFQYTLEGNKLELRIFHDGADENPSMLPTDDLESEVRYYSVPLTGYSFNSLTLTFDKLSTNAEGTSVVEPYTAYLR